MPRPTLPDSFSRVRSMNVLLTKHTAEEVWDHLARGFSNFECKAQEYIDKLNGLICDFRRDCPYNRIDWRRNYTSGSASKHRIDTLMWNGYEDEDFDRLWDYGRDLHILKDEFKDKEDYDRFARMSANFQDAMRLLRKEYERIEKHAWESCKRNWEIEDAEWIKYQEFVKEHRNHKSVEEQTKNRDNYIKQYPAEREMLLGGRWEIVDYTLTCSLCQAAAQEAKRIEELIAQREIELARANEAWRAEKEAERKAKEEEKRSAYASLPVMTCDACKFTTKSNSAWEVHEESKDHKNNVRDQSLFCEKCNHRSRCRAEHVFHLHSKKHLGEVEVKEKPSLYCEICDYTAKNKGNYDYHMKSNKHIKKAGV
jgi:hypothetical protein